MRIGGHTAIHIDRGAIELLGPHGLSTYLYKASSNLNKIDTGVITDYSLGIVISIISIGFVLFFPIYTGYGLGDFALLLVYLAITFYFAYENNIKVDPIVNIKINNNTANAVRIISYRNKSRGAAICLTY